MISTILARSHKKNILQKAGALMTKAEITLPLRMPVLLQSRMEYQIRDWIRDWNKETVIVLGKCSTIPESSLRQRAATLESTSQVLIKRFPYKLIFFIG